MLLWSAPDLLAGETGFMASTSIIRPAAASVGEGGWRAPLLLALAMAALYSINLDRLPDPDELHHVLAAQGLLATGEPRIAEGLYERVFLHTQLVAWSYQLFGESLWASRVPTLLFTVATDVLLFVWLRRHAGSTAAWIGAGLWAISPFAVSTAQFSRFYALQVLTFTGGCILVEAALAGAVTAGRRYLLGVAAAALLLLALSLQPTTLLGLAGLGLWVAGFVALPRLRDGRIALRTKAVAVAAVLAGGLAAVGLAFLIVPDTIAELWGRYRWTPIFNRGTESQFWYYHGWLSLLYPTFWPLIGILSLVALAARPRIAGLALVVFATGFLLSSFAAAKALRYFAYAMPFLFVLMGIGVAAVLPPLRSFLVSLSAELERALGSWRWAARPLIVGALLFLVLANPFWVRTATYIADVAVPPEVPMPNWPRAKEALMPWIERADVVVTTEELGTLYFLGRFDVRFSPSKLEELPPEEEREFGRDPRTGRAVISTQASLELLMRCYPSGIVLGLASDWGKRHKISPEIGAMIRARTEPLPLPQHSNLFAYTWERAGTPSSAPECASTASVSHKS